MRLLNDYETVEVKLTVTELIWLSTALASPDLNRKESDKEMTQAIHKKLTTEQD